MYSFYNGTRHQLFPNFPCKQSKLERPWTEKLKSKHLNGEFKMF